MLTSLEGEGMKVGFFKDVGEITALFYRSFIYVISNSLVFIDAYCDTIDIRIQKGNCIAIIVEGYQQLLEKYHLNYGGWLKVKYVGRNKFFIDQVIDHNMHLVSNYTIPIKFLLDNNKFVVKDVNVDSTDHAILLVDGDAYVPSSNVGLVCPTQTPDNLMISLDHPSSENQFFMTSIFDGLTGDSTNGESQVVIPEDILFNDTHDGFQKLVSFVYAKLLPNLNNINYFKERTILAPTLKVMHAVNNTIMEYFNTNEKDSKQLEVSQFNRLVVLPNRLKFVRD
ncbi:hypothetical protein Ahy_B07g087649 [Arachis hypogaea]|uniref:Uncharacterized protein n=1 Tax=Arachis hypogaea TaxID=3818 RepID=A0A444YCM6_ARAHY|nr:hypothetical protein Ahy_B07g087649 [Arachis hypogaea]